MFDIEPERMIRRNILFPEETFAALSVYAAKKNISFGKVVVRMCNYVINERKKLDETSNMKKDR